MLQKIQDNLKNIPYWQVKYIQCEANMCVNRLANYNVTMSNNNWLFEECLYFLSDVVSRKLIVE